MSESLKVGASAPLIPESPDSQNQLPLKRKPGRPRKYPQGTSEYSKKDQKAQFALGRVKVASASGRKAGSHAAKLLKNLGNEDITSGAELIPLLEADPSPSAKTELFCIKWQESADSGEKVTVRTLAGRAKTTVAEILVAASRGMRELGIAEARARVADKLTERLGAVMDTLIDQALPQEISCENCQATGKAFGKWCNVCSGKGKIDVLPPNYAFSVKEVLKLAQIVEEKGGIQISQTNNSTKNTLIAGGGLMEKLAAYSDKMVFDQIEPIDAVLIAPTKETPHLLPQIDPTAPGEARTADPEAVEA